MYCYVRNWQTGICIQGLVNMAWVGSELDGSVDFEAHTGASSLAASLQLYSQMQRLTSVWSQLGA